MKKYGMELIGVEYLTSIGMTHGDDFSIKVKRDKIVNSRYFCRYDYEYKEISDVVITKKQWEKIESAVYAILPSLKIFRPRRHRLSLFIGFGDAIALDGPNESVFTLTWQSSDGKKDTIRYYSPSDRRFLTLISILMETANPIGREIVYYDTPIINGLCLVHGTYGKRSYFSYQFSFDNNSQDEWRFIAYYEKNGSFFSFKTKLGAKEWNEFSQKFSLSKLESFKLASSGSNSSATICYSDSTRRTVKLDRATFKHLRSAFEVLLSDCETE